MISPRLLLCSGASVSDNDSLRQDRVVLDLDSIGNKANVNLRLQDVARVLKKNLSPRLIDLLEIASYVFTADAATRRGTEWTNDSTTEAWERDFTFVIPVRDEPFWNSSGTQQLLIELLNFLSNDKYQFIFTNLKQDRSVQEYFEFGDEEDWGFYGAPRVLMFSGGLDSLAGAIESAAKGEKLLFVSHRPVSTLDHRQKELVREFRTKYHNPLVHIPVWINKAGTLGREHTQRTRSFLYSALGLLIAESTKSDGVRFFENGVVSLNLPVADEVQRARASRTTHPRSLALLTSLYRLVTDREFVVDNPFIFKTKTEVLSIVMQHGAGSLIQHTCSCVHTGHFHSKTHWHCGTCSQCIDRRIAIMAAGAESFDRETDYVSDVFTGPRKEGPEYNIAVDYVRHATELNMMSQTEIATRFNRDISRAVRHFPEWSKAAEDFVSMHKRHGESVCAILTEQIKANAERLLNRSLDKTSMLALVAGQEHLESVWKRYADRLAGLLQTGIPLVCTENNMPENEPRLQEICDGILQPHDPELQREFPFMRWSASATKPDWSKEGLGLWIELKYVQDKKDIARITSAIAEDITKYGDNGRRVLYVVYDPKHLIKDEVGFSEPILKRPTMLVHFVR
jgi:hypothetical protein